MFGIIVHMKFKTFITACIVLFSSLFATQSRADCYDDAAIFHNVNPWILKAIAFNESSFRPDTVSSNTNGSIDIGLTGTNSVHLKELATHGIEKNDLLNPCKSIYVSAWMLAKKMKKHGNTWNAVGAYHSETPHLRDIYAMKIQNTVAQWSKQTSVK